MPILHDKQIFRRAADLGRRRQRTVRENVEVSLAVIGVPQEDWSARIGEVLKLVGLSSRASLFPSQLSGGEIQRASLARALAVNPKLILADEPTGNLDWGTSETIMELLEKINKEGKTVVMATHNEMIVDKYKKRMIKLAEGRLVSKEKVEDDKKDEKEGVEKNPKKEENKKEDKKVKVKVEEV